MDEAFNGIRCDVCGKEHLFEPGVIVSGVFAIPDGWFMLYRGEHRRHLSSPIFCSVPCLAQWAKEQVMQEVR